MADINLEAEQVIDEEEERASSKKGGGIFARKGVLIFAAIVLAEAVVLFFVFDAIRSDGPAKADAPEVPEVALFDYLKTPGRIVVDDISIYDDSDSSIRSDKRFTIRIVLRVDGKVYEEIQRATEVNPAALDLIKDEIKERVRFYLLDQGGNFLKSTSEQKLLGSRLRDFLNQELPPLRGKILEVHLDDFRPSRM